jgi:hypothetical protein
VTDINDPDARLLSLHLEARPLTAAQATAVLIRIGWYVRDEGSEPCVVPLLLLAVSIALLDTVMTLGNMRELGRP